MFSFLEVFSRINTIHFLKYHIAEFWKKKKKHSGNLVYIYREFSFLSCIFRYSQNNDITDTKVDTVQIV